MGCSIARKYQLYQHLTTLQYNRKIILHFFEHVIFNNSNNRKRVLLDYTCM
jgi:hypothetical protein